MILIIGYGNPLRGDDGAGLALAERLEQECVGLGWSVRRLFVHQLTPELALEIADPQVHTVLFVDTRVAQDEDDRAVRVEEVWAEAASRARLGHHADPAMTMAYAGLLTAGPLPRAWLVTVPGVAFDHGQTLSAEAVAAVEQGAGAVLRLLAEEVPA
ncbi:MAG: hydrogenase maturation protease [Caldilineales bacterium]|nr:hydrogenase maturation protease [Caldilineales bacterium]MDW8316624.1 hydrogenase maturation protease [Anaerolineae bacterium]